MNLKTKEATLKANIKFKIELERQKLFFDKPEALKLLKKAGLAVFDAAIPILEAELLIFLESQLAKLLKSNKISKAVLDYTSNETNTADLLSSCTIEDPNDTNALLAHTSSIDTITDSDAKKLLDKILAFLSSSIETAELIAGISMLLLFIYKELKKLFTRNEHISKHRTKYLQRLIRNTYQVLKAQYAIVKEQIKTEVGNVSAKIEGMLESLKHLDKILMTIAVATATYFINRALLQRKSKQTLDDVSKDAACTVSPEPVDPSVNINPFTPNLDCPVITDDDLVPHVPIEVKLEELSCEIAQNTETVTDSTASPDLATYAIIRNSSSKLLYPLVTKDSQLDQTTAIGTYNGKALYSPVIGYVDQINPSEFILRDIHDPEEDYLTNQIDSLGKKYERLNSVKPFLKTYYVPTLYLGMLAVAIIDDVSVKNIYTGVNSRFDDVQKGYGNLVDDYDKTIKDITGKDNVEMHAKNETLTEIKTQIETEDEKFYKNLDITGQSAFNLAKKTQPKKDEYLLFGYYFELVAGMNAIENPNSVEIEFRDIINDFARKRFVLDKYKKKDIENKINDEIKKIEKGVSLGNWFKKAMDVYEPSKKLTDLKNWLTGLAQQNNKLEGSQKTYAVNRVMYLFEFYLTTADVVNKYAPTLTNTTPKDETIKEGNLINLYMANLWKEMIQINIDIDNINKTIDALTTFKTYSITKWNDYPARLYTLCDDPKCKSVETNDYVNPSSKYGYADIQYWMKYCAYATLASVTNPATGWSTGWIVPNPILFPVVYVPVKSIETKYGFIVMGITICGIWIFPWALFGNLSAGFNTPLGNPTAALKREIEALKKTINDGLKSLKKGVVKKMLDETKAQVDRKNEDIAGIKKSIADLKSQKPKKLDRSLNEKKTETPIEEQGIIANAKDLKQSITTGVQANLLYAEQYATWVQTGLSLQEQLLTAKTEKLVLVRKYKLLNAAYKENKSVKGIEGLEQSEKVINAQLDQLDMMTDNVDKILAPLPITMQPDTANFGITLKNTKPIINIAKDLDDNVNQGPLDKIVAKFALNNADMMNNTYSAKLYTTVVNYKQYTQALGLASSATVKKDPFPKYELLKPTNVQWASFLYKDFVTTGAKTYGFPGQLPIPI